MRGLITKTLMPLVKFHVVRAKCLVMRILVVEDDELIAQGLVKILSNETYAVEVATDGQLAWELIETFDYDLVLLDVELPKLDGIQLCKMMRSHHYQMPVLLLTGRDNGHDKAVGLDAGADDYVVKPFDPEELAARIRALLRRGNTVVESVLTWGDLQLNPTTHDVSWRSQPLSLTAKEYALLELFLRNPRRVFSCGMILEHLWSYETMPGDEAVRTHIKCLRQKIKAAGIPNDLIETVYGIGYRLKDEKVVNSDSEANDKKPVAVNNGSAPSANAPKIQTSNFKTQTAPNTQDPIPNTQQAIAKVWERFKGRVAEQVGVLEQVAIHAKQGAIASKLWQQAQREAHTLAGALGTFGFPNGSQLARQIEQVLKAASSRTLPDDDVEHLQQLVSLLSREVSRSPQPKTTTTTVVDERLLLIVDSDPTLFDTLTADAALWGFRVKQAVDLTSARDEIYRDRPDVVLLEWDGKQPSNHRQQLKGNANFLTELSQQQPPIPTLICTDHNGLTKQLEVVRLGGHNILHKPLSAVQLLEAANKVVQQANATNVRVLAVDDDPQTLVVLKTLLEPWGLTVFLLDNPQQFWPTLEATAPDLLILDVEMPDISGIELCQIVRHDARWNGLPILFLTAHTDADVVNQVFAVGADDFVSKPIVGPELVTRIINRFERIRLLRYSSEVNPATGLANRSWAIPQINLLLRLAARHCQNLCLAILKPVNLKDVGDRQGYTAIQAVLRETGHLLQQAFQGDSVVAYWGDETFVVVLYGVTPEAGTQSVTDILGTLHQHLTAVVGLKAHSITVYYGLAGFPTDGDTVQTLYSVADAALRNKLTIPHSEKKASGNGRSPIPASPSPNAK
jgi:diguanylate cyclase (GGDEF)-like protein